MRAFCHTATLTLTGEVRLARAEERAVTVNGLENGILRVEVFAGSPHVWLATRGDSRAAVDRFEGPWREMPGRLFPAAAGRPRL